MHHKKQLSLAVASALGLTAFLTIPGQVFAQDEQTSDDGDRHGRPDLSTFSDPESQWKKAKGRRKGRHEDRSKAKTSAFNDGLNLFYLVTIGLK